MNNIKALREAQNLSQAQLAVALNVCQQAVAKWERGTGDPKWSMVPQLSDVLQCPIDELFDGPSPTTIIS